MTTGRGRTLGHALVNLYDQLSGSTRRTSFKAKGWHAQLRELYSAKVGERGRATRIAAREAAGMGRVPIKQLTGWLTGRVTPNAANRALIGRAYRQLQGGFNDDALRTEIRISGQVTLYSNGRRDSRIRGRGGRAPLRVDGTAGTWDRIGDEWDRGNRDPGNHEIYFILDVLEADIGEVSDGSWGTAFDGDWYEVEV